MKAVNDNRIGKMIMGITVTQNEYITLRRSKKVGNNPPYGDRLLDAAQAEALYRGMGRAWRGAQDWRFYILTSSLDFEKSFGRRAAKRRKLYNGPIPCQLYMYF